MNTKKINGTEVRILDSQFETANITSEVVEDCLQEFVGRRRSKKLAETIMEHLSAWKDEVIVEVNEKRYKLILTEDLVPIFEEFDSEDVWESVRMLLTKQCIEQEEVYECIDSIKKASKQEKKIVDGIEIPEGFHYVTGNNQEGVVIEDQKGNQFTTFKEINFWVSRYEISRGGKSIAGEDAWTNINFPDSRKVAKAFAKNADLFHEREWDELMQAISSRIGRGLVYEDSTSIGAYANSCGEVKTGSNPNCMVCNIDCLAGNHWCWIVKNDENEEDSQALGGGSYCINGHNWPMDSRINCNPNYSDFNVGFRIVLKK